MRPINFTLLLFAVISLYAQPTLTYENHALKAEVDNPMTYCLYADPGEAGSNVVWDFTELKALKEFTGHISSAEHEDFYISNTELEEFGTRFYYNVNEKGIWHYGYQSKSGKVKVVYSEPFEKIRYPMNFKDTYFSSFAGEYLADNIHKASIDGTSEFEADAWGTILLPGGTQYENTIRVKSVKKYTQVFENTTQDIEIITYRWYNSVHRYPLVALIETKSTTGGKTSKGNQAAYNLNAVKNATSIVESTAQINATIYPNPASQGLFMDVDSDITGTGYVSFADLSGRELVAEFKVELISGPNTLSMDEAFNSLPDGLYMAKIRINDKIITQEVSIVR